MPTTTGPLKPEILTDEQVRAESMAKGLDRLAWLMDRAIQIPGTNIHVGLDALIGLIPGGGDLIAGLIQTGIVLVAVHHYKVPKAVAARMASNVLLDTTLGAIPFVGDVWDAFFKANTRNIKLLEQVRDQQKAGKPIASGASVRYLIGLATILFVTLGLVFVGLITVVVWLAKAVTH